jgi:hypothetical protein
MAKDDVKVEIPPGPLGKDAQVKAADEMSKDELKEVIIRDDDKRLHPAPSSAALNDELGAQVDPERPPFATGRPDVEILSGLAAGPGAHTPPDPAKYDAEGRLKDLK